eukprot:31801_4
MASTRLQLLVKTVPSCSFCEKKMAGSITCLEGSALASRRMRGVVLVERPGRRLAARQNYPRLHLPLLGRLRPNKRCSYMKHLMSWPRTSKVCVERLRGCKACYRQVVLQQCGFPLCFVTPNPVS